MAPNEQAEDARLVCLSCKRTFLPGVRVCPDDGGILVPSSVDELVGTTLSGLYEIMGIIGRGGTSVVYKARHALMDRLVAIKMLLWSSDGLREEKRIRRFQQEARTASRLNHPHIATLYDFGISPQGQPFLVMEYIEGHSLEELIHTGGAMQVERALRLFIQITDAMEHAHQRGVVHRDLKPSNFILAMPKDGTTEESIKVVDFGVAELISDRMQDSNMQLAEQVFGSPLYMSPEQCLNKNIDSRCDIYCLGVSMYQVLTARLPFLGNTLVEVMSKHISEIPPTFRKAAPNLQIPKSVEEAVMRALRKVPAQRHQSMKSLREQLQSASSGSGKEVLVNRKIRVFIVDDNEVIIDAIKQALQRFEDVEVVGGARRATAALAAVEELKPEIVLMDLEMPEMDGIEATKLLKEKLPKSHVVMMSSHQDEKDIVAALRAGAEGFILKKFENNSLPLAVRAVVQGTIWLDPGINSSVLDRYRQSAPDIVERAARVPTASRKEGTDDISFVISLADVFVQADKFEEAEALYRVSLTIIEKVKNASHPDLLKVLLKLADVYVHEDKPMQAEPLYFQALEIQTQTLGPEHSDTATTLEHIAELFNRQAMYAEAERFYYWALSVREKVQPPDFMQVADTCMKLAQIYREQQKFGQAEQFAELARRKQARARALQEMLEPTLEEMPMLKVPES